MKPFDLMKWDIGSVLDLGSNGLVLNFLIIMNHFASYINFFGGRWVLDLGSREFLNDLGLVL